MVDCLAPKETDSGSNTSIEADVDDDRIVVVKHTSTSAVPQSADNWMDSSSTGVVPRRSGREAAAEEEREVRSVNVFVVESEQNDATRDNGTLHSDMKPLLVQGDVGFQPSVPQTDPNFLVVGEIEEEISGPVTDTGVRPFQTAAPFTVSGVDQTASDQIFPVVEAGGESSKKSGTALPSDVVEQTKLETDAFPVEGPPRHVEVAGGLRHPSAVKERSPPTEKPGVDAGPRPVVELSCSVVIDFVASWFESPWIAYLLVVVGATLAASATEADPAALIIAVLVASAFCFCFYPPPSISAEDTPADRSTD